MTTAMLFERLWSTLADVLGTPAAAVLLRRAIKRAVVSAPELGGLAIHREELGYGYTLPVAWEVDGPEPAASLRALVVELCPLLVELTGLVVVRRLARIPEIEAWMASDGDLS
jgi:hypothetical protein